MKMVMSIGWRENLCQYQNIANGKGFQTRLITQKQHVKKVHRLVAEAYLENPNPFEFNQVGHKDENKLNNCVQNLEYTNATLNNQMPKRRARISNSVKNTKQISGYAIQCVETKELFNSYKEVAKKMNRAYSTVIADIKNGWALNGFHFILIDKS